MNREKEQNIIKTDAAVLKCGNAMKGNLGESPFCRKIDNGSSKDGNWSYEDMVIQLKDCADMFRSINGDKFDYCFLFDHSNGQDQMV